VIQLLDAERIAPIAQIGTTRSSDAAADRQVIGLLIHNIEHIRNSAFQTLQEEFQSVQRYVLVAHLHPVKR
jgi:hypothetical protein